MNKRGGLGRGLAALIPTSVGSRPAVMPAASSDEDAQVEGGGPTPAQSSAPPDAAHRPPAGDGAPPHAAAEQSPVAPGGDAAGGDPPAVGADPAPRGTGVEIVDAPDDSRAPRPVPGLALTQIRRCDIAPNPQQPRQAFDDEALEELAHSIREVGLLQPIVVRPIEGGTYQLVMGERRVRAAALAGLDTVTAIVRDTADDALLRDALLENIHRVQLNPLEEAAAYDQLLGEFGVTHEELAARLGRSRSQVTNTIRLLRLPAPVQRRVAAGVLSAGHARAVLGLDNSAAQEALATRIVAEGLSVRATEELVATSPTAPGRTRARRTGRISAPGADDLAARLSDAYDTRVRVEIGRRKGRIVVEFGSIDDLERIVALMQPEQYPVPTAGTEPVSVPTG